MDDGFRRQALIMDLQNGFDSYFEREKGVNANPNPYTQPNHKCNSKFNQYPTPNPARKPNPMN